MTYAINNHVYFNVMMFYENVMRKYPNTYTKENFDKDYDNIIGAIYQIENGLLRRTPILSRWKGYYMANSDKWYFAYRIDGETIYVDDACHAQNMHEAVEHDPIRIIKEWMVRLGCIS